MKLGARCAATLLLSNSLLSVRGFHCESKRSLGNCLLQCSSHPPKQRRIVCKMATFSSTSSASLTSGDGAKYNFSWQQTMLRIKDPKLSVPFYEDLGFKLVHFYNFPQWNFSLYFLAFIPDEEKFDLVPGSPESESYLWSCKSEYLKGMLFTQEVVLMSFMSFPFK